MKNCLPKGRGELVPRVPLYPFRSAVVAEVQLFGASAFLTGTFETTFGVRGVEVM
jgi:hypothetical protein